MSYLKHDIVLIVVLLAPVFVVLRQAWFIIGITIPVNS